MTPAARLQAAIEILDALNDTAQPADRFLRDWFSVRRYAGSKDRAAVAEHIYSVLRHRASLSWRMESDDSRSLVIGSLLSDGASAADVSMLFAAGGYGPSPLSEAEHGAMAHPPAPPAPAYAIGEYPQWLAPELLRAFGDNLPAEMAAMLARAPVDLRVNRLRASRDDVMAGLIGLGFDAHPTPTSPDGIRVPSGAGLSALQRTEFFQTGAIEFQDESSQIAALLCGTRPYMRVLDMAAGTGGKALALAAIMENKGEIIACDTDAKRLARLRPRSARAGSTIIRPVLLSQGSPRPRGDFDIVLVDAPCSGSGTWRRNPEFKWRLSAERLAAFGTLQAQLLDDAVRHAGKSGRLVYATCSLLPTENQDQIDAFLTRRPEFSMQDASKMWAEGLGARPPGLDRVFRASPLRSGTDGFFLCALARTQTKA